MAHLSNIFLHRFATLDYVDQTILCRARFSPYFTILQHLPITQQQQQLPCPCQQAGYASICAPASCCEPECKGTSRSDAYALKCLLQQRTEHPHTAELLQHESGSGVDTGAVHHDAHCCTRRALASVLGAARERAKTNQFNSSHLCDIYISTASSAAAM